jgi:L,D-transpeptidase ErfK/SrfK
VIVKSEISIAALLLPVLMLIGASAPAWGTTYRLPPSGDEVVGEISATTVSAGATLIDIARDYDLGYNELVEANPGLDPWLPPTGAEVILPTQYVLPNAPRQGIVVNVAEMRLYYYPPPAADGAAVVLTFPIGIGQEGTETPLGVTTIVSKAADPSWVVPVSVRQEYARDGVTLPAVVPPGPDNPLGRHALRLGWMNYLIHGSNKPFGIGMRVSHGCIRMYARDVERLFHMVPLSTPVRIIDQPNKLGKMNGKLYLESHPPIASEGKPVADYLAPIVPVVEAAVAAEYIGEARDAVARITGRRSGIPESVAALRAVDSPEARVDGWVLQVGAFSKRANALRLRDDLAARGMRVSLHAHSGSGYCHVLVGPFAQREQALKALDGYVKSTGRQGSVLPAGQLDLSSECAL